MAIVSESKKKSSCSGRKRPNPNKGKTVRKAELKSKLVKRVHKHNDATIPAITKSAQIIERQTHVLGQLHCIPGITLNL
jgi:hypothetical protein